VCAVFAADRAELGLDQNIGGMRSIDDSTGRCHVFVIGKSGSVVHHRTEAKIDGFERQPLILGVVEVHGHRRRG
jgi:hypothetical protein